MQNQITNMENQTMISNLTLCQKANSVKLNMYSFGYATVKSNWNGYVKNPEFSRLYYIISGKAYIEYNNIKLVLSPGNWYLIPAELSFDFWCDNEMEHLFFHITLTSADEIDLLSKVSEPVFMEDDSEPNIIYSDFLKSESLFSALTVKEKIYNTVLNLVARSHTILEIREFSACVQKALEFINNNLCEKLDLATIAQYSYVSKCTLTNKFRKELNITVLEYIQRQKMFKAVQMLKNSAMSVSEISKKLGFSEQFYFSRCFKQKFGLSPLEYRKSKIN